jgi:nucleoside-diphosphate-sugar epimerase
VPPVPPALADTRGILTGASGFVGRRILELLPEGCRVLATHRDPGFPAFAAGCAADVEPVAIDLAEEPLAPRADGDWDWLIHCAAPLPSSGGDPTADAAAIEAMAVHAVRGIEVDQVVHCSSGAVYAGLEGEIGPWSECAPRSAYGAAKLAAEAAIEAAAFAPVVHLRLFHPYGPGERPNRLIPSLVRAAIEGREEVEIRLPRAHRVQPIWIGDLAATVASFALLPGGGAVDVCGDRAYDMPELVAAIYGAVAPGLEPAIVGEPAPGADDAMVAGVASPAACDALVGVPRLLFPDGVRRYADALRSSTST